MDASLVSLDGCLIATFEDPHTYTRVFESYLSALTRSHVLRLFQSFSMVLDTRPPYDSVDSMTKEDHHLFEV